MASSKVPKIFSQRRRMAGSARAKLLAQNPEAARWLVEEIEADLIERLGFMRFAPKSALIVGLSSGKLESSLGSVGCKVTAKPSINEEAPIEGDPFDLIASLNRLGTVNDLPGALIHMRSALAPGGIAIASFVGAGSLPKLRQIMLAADGERPASRIHPQIDNQAGSALQERAGFARHVVDSVSVKASYTSLEKLIADLREQALTNVLADPPPPITKAGLARARVDFDRLRDDQGRVTEVFEILTLTGWA